MLYPARAVSAASPGWFIFDEVFSLLFGPTASATLPVDRITPDEVSSMLPVYEKYPDCVELPRRVALYTEIFCPARYCARTVAFD
ncbi:hypothetical protein DSECCO2_620110 [anaerobic digester metagenome]